jgi:hypothetical protein
MKSKKKSKARSKRLVAPLPIGMQPTHQIAKSHLVKEASENTFTAMETGQPDQDFVPGIDNPQGVQGGHGPLNQEGEGERQNDQLAELEQIEPDK